jgi:hypothetical protein
MEEDEIDIPLDPLGMTDDNEIHEFLTTHPGCEEEDYEPAGSDPLPVTSDRHIVKNPPIGIPDSFVPGEWRDHFDINSVA